MPRKAYSYAAYRGGAYGAYSMLAYCMLFGAYKSSTIRTVHGAYRGILYASDFFVTEEAGVGSKGGAPRSDG